MTRRAEAVATSAAITGEGEDDEEDVGIAIVPLQK